MNDRTAILLSRPARILFHLAFGQPLVSLSISAVFYLVGRQALLEPYSGMDLRFTVGAAVVLGTGYLLMTAASGQQRESDRFAVFLFCYVAYSAALGAIHLLLLNDPEYSWRAYAPHFSAGLLIASGYAIFSGERVAIRSWMEPRLRVYGAASLIVVAVYLLGFIQDWQRNNTYWGPSTGTLLVPAAWYLATRRPRLATLASILIVVNGKRGPAVALLAQLLLAWRIAAPQARHHGRGRLPFLIASAAVVIVALGAVVWTFSAVDRGTASPILEATVFKWRYLNTRSGEFDMDVATAGRSIEIRDAIAQMNEVPSRWVVGTGYGWAFSVDGGGSRLHYLHFSPFNLVMQYGLPLTLVFFAGVWRIIAQGVRQLQRTRDPDPVLMGLVLLVVASLVEGFFAYMYAVNPLIWFSLGAVAACTRVRASAPVTARLAGPLPPLALTRVG